MTLFLAIWGAVVSTVALVWNIYRDVIDRPKLKVEASLRRLAVGNGIAVMVAPDLNLEGAGRPQIAMTVTNLSKHAVTRQGWGGKYKTARNGKGSFAIMTRQLPKRLGQSETHTEFAEINSTWTEGNIQETFAWDSSGKHWPVSAQAQSASSCSRFCWSARVFSAMFACFRL